jgi:hypothetical protein
MREYARKRRAEDPSFVEKQREAGRKSRLNRLEKSKQECKNWREKNKEKIVVYNNEYAKNNRTSINQKRSSNNKKKRKTNPIFNLQSRERVRIWEALRGKRKTARSTNLLGCSYEFLKEYIESLFIDGMSWENISEWHVDHIRPLASFDLNDIEQQKIAFNYKNLQPLWAKDNMEKGAKYA